MRTVALALLLMLSVGPVAALECDFLNTVWESKQRVLYFDPIGSPDHHTVAIELWEGKTLLTRIYGSLMYQLGGPRPGPELGDIAILKKYVPSSENGSPVPSDVRVSAENIRIEVLGSPSKDQWLVLSGISDQAAMVNHEAYARYFMAFSLEDDSFRKAGCREGPLVFPVTKEEAELAANPCGWKAGDVYIGDDMAFGISACTMDKSKAYFALSCSLQKGAIDIQYELAKGLNGAVSDSGPINVEFATEVGSWGLIMTGNDMDGTHVTEVGHVNPVIEYIANSSTLTISDKKGEYPIRKVSLEGSREAIDTLLRKCVGP